MITHPQLGRSGRLGNQLFQIASTVGIADMLGDKACFPEWDYRPYFSVPTVFFQDCEGVPAYETPPVEHIDPRQRVYLQDYSLFRHIAPEVRAWFQPTGQVIERLWEPELEWFHELTSHALPVLSLHVRRGDNVTHPDSLWPMPTAGYYRRALAEFPQHEYVIVFSDDIPWCKENVPAFDDKRMYYFVEGNPPRPPDYNLDEYLAAGPIDWTDLHLMAMVPGPHIISNSTYSWWGAFLSSQPGHVAYPSKWVGPRIDYFDWHTMMPEDWREIPC